MWIFFLVVLYFWLTERSFFITFLSLFLTWLGFKSACNCCKQCTVHCRSRCRWSLHKIQKASKATGVFKSPGRVHQRWTEESQKGVTACTRRSKKNPVCPSSHWPVLGGCRSKYRDCWLHYRSVIISQLSNLPNLWCVGPCKLRIECSQWAVFCFCLYNYWEELVVI